MAMQSAALLAAENRELRAANEKQKRKRERRCIYIGQKDALIIEEGVNRVRRANEEERGVIKVSKDQPRKRAAPRCSVCGTIGHTARTCSQRTRNSS
jgi:ribosomal protein S14